MKPGRDHFAGGVDGALAWRSGEVADGRDSSLADSDIAGIPGRAGAVNNMAVDDDKIEGGRGANVCADNTRIGSQQNHASPAHDTV